MFINCTNHPSAQWSKAQLEAAEAYGQVADFPFPSVDPAADRSEIQRKAEMLAEELAAMQPAAVLCQGEMTLCFALVNLLKQRSIPVFAACNERRTVETQTPTGSTLKQSEFVFCRFREY